MTTKISRLYSFLTDYQNGNPISDVKIDAELDALITALNKTVVAGATSPTDPSPESGFTWFDTSNNVIKYFDGSSFTVLANNSYYMLTHFSSGNQTTGTKKYGWFDNGNGVITGCYAYLDTAPAGSNFIIDINSNGTSIFGGGDKLVISDGSNSGSQTTISTTSGDRITYDIDQIGSGTAGADLYILLKMKIGIENPT